MVDTEVQKTTSPDCVVTFVRHGETKTNQEDILMGRGQGELTPRGIKMAMKVGERLENEKFTRAYSSDLQRCKDTTDQILKASKHSPLPNPEYREILRERDFGSLEGQPWVLVKKAADEQKCPTFSVDLPEAETYEEVVKRASSFFKELCDLADNCAETGENILVVCHGAWMKCLLHGYIINNFQLENFKELHALNKLKTAHISNTCVTKVTIEKYQENSPRKIVFHNLLDVSHLNGLV